MKSMRMAQCTQAATSKKVLTRKLDAHALHIDKRKQIISMSQYHQYREVAMAAKGRKDFPLFLSLGPLPSPRPPLIARQDGA